LIFFRLSLGFSYEFEGDITHARAIIEIEQNHLLPSSQRGFALLMGIAMDGPKSRPGDVKKPLSSPNDRHGGNGDPRESAARRILLNSESIPIRVRSW